MDIILNIQRRRERGIKGEREKEREIGRERRGEREREIQGRGHIDVPPMLGPVSKHIGFFVRKQLFLEKLPAHKAQQQQARLQLSQLKGRWQAGTVRE